MGVQTQDRSRELGQLVAVADALALSPTLYSPAKTHKSEQAAIRNRRTLNLPRGLVCAVCHLSILY